MAQSTNAFQALTPNARSHFSILFYAAVYHLMDYLAQMEYLSLAEVENTEMLDGLFERHPFLAEYFSEIVDLMPGELTWQEGHEWWQAEVEQWEKNCPVHLPLYALSSKDSLGFQNRVALLLAGLGEEDSRFGDLFATLHGSPAHRRPTVELLGHIVLSRSAPLDSDPWRICRPLLSWGLLQIVNKEAARSEWLLRVSPLLWDLIRGETTPHLADWCRYSPPTDHPQLEQLIFPADFRRQVEQIPRLLSEGGVSVLMLRGMPGSESQMLMGAVARTLGYGLLHIEDFDGLDEVERRPIGAMCRMLQAWPVLILDPGPGETRKLPSLPGYTGPLGVLMGIEGGLDTSAMDETLTLTVPVPSASGRRQIWQQAFGAHPVTDLDVISDSVRLPGGYIRQIAPLAITQAALAGEEAVRPVHVRSACRTLNRQMLDSLAVRLENNGAWEQLIANEITIGRLQELEKRCRYRERLPGYLSSVFQATAKQGVSALFTGPSGTGKTFAARILAAELQMDLYRVDLAAVVNKYIGETEKNLHRVLSHAEALDVILLLDEGDALLGSRTEVKSSNDRYANLETDYLLQRLEHYQGIIIITTNASEYIDSAFQRRIDVSVPFVPPDADARRHIWQLHLPPNHRIDPSILDTIATRCTLTGGQIRNAALYAALLAVENGGIVTNQQLEAAIQSEYRKAGATFPFRNGLGATAKANHNNGMGSFLHAIKSTPVRKN
jgi:AAA+ superfamily predicted ATPase